MKWFQDISGFIEQAFNKNWLLYFIIGLLGFLVFIIAIGILKITGYGNS